MKKLTDALQTVAVTLWAGGLWMTALLVQVLFSTLHGDRMLAGMIAGKFFIAMSYTGMACGLYLVLFRLSRFGWAAWKQLFFWLVLVLLGLVLAGHFGIQPVLQGLKDAAQPLDVMGSTFKDSFMKWHGISSLVYLAECLLALGLVLAHKASR